MDELSPSPVPRVPFPEALPAFPRSNVVFSHAREDLTDFARWRNKKLGEKALAGHAEGKGNSELGEDTDNGENSGLEKHKDKELGV